MLSPVLVVVAAMVSTTTSWVVQGPAAPVQGDRGEHAVLDLVPLRGARRQVAHGDPQPGLGGQLSELGLPQP